MLSLTVRQVIKSDSCLVNGSVFSVIEMYEWTVLLCKIFDFYYVVLCLGHQRSLLYILCN